MAEVSPIILLDAVKEARNTLRAEAFLYEFLKQAWHVVEPGVEFTHGWHLQIICEHLEALSAGEIRKLLVNIPPRHSKSTIISVIYPVWQWLHNPSEQFLTASYSATLSTRDAAKSRHLLTSPWFQDRWGDRFTLSGDTNAKQRYQNDKRGYRISTSVGGTATGEGGSILILDDPHGAQDAQSDAMRGAALEWFDMVWSTRLNNARSDKMATIMQRLHSKDTSGHILADLGGWEHICLPAEYDGVKRTTSVFVEGYDPREKKGELLWPERVDEKTLKDLKRALGEYAYEGQMMQRPSPPGGGILKVDHFQLWPTTWELPVFDYVVQTVDPAYTEKTTNDPTAFQAWGIFTHKGRRGAMLLDCWADHLTFPDLRSKLVEEWHSIYGKTQSRKGKKADALLIEAKASGLSMIQDLRQANLPAIPYNPGTADKINRAHQVAPILELDCLWIPESAKESGKAVTWARLFLTELEKFPNAEHDDQCVAKGTLISMGDGTLKPIEDIKVGEEVLTPEGSRKVLVSACTGVKSVWNVKVGDRNIFATGNHPFALRQGIYGIITDMSNLSEVVCLSNLSFHLQKLNTLISTVRSTIATRIILTRAAEPTLSGGEVIYTATCGNITTDLFRKVTAYTTSTGTRGTTESKTLNVCLPENTCLFMEKKMPRIAATNKFSILKEFANWLQVGTGPKKVENGTVKWLKDKLQKVETTEVDTKESSGLSRVVGVVTRLKNAARKLCSVVIRANLMNQVTVERVSLSPPQHTSEVYNLTVEGAHCYYANGFLTHNCDAFTQCMIYLRDGGWFELPAADLDESEEVDYYAKKASINPYAA